MSSASVRFGTKAYVCARYFLRPGKCFKYMDQCGEDATELLEELKSYKEAEEQGLLVRLPTNKNKEIYIISSRWTVCSEYGLRFDEYSCIGCEYECDSEKEYYIHSTYLSFIDVTTYVNQFGKQYSSPVKKPRRNWRRWRNE